MLARKLQIGSIKTSKQTVGKRLLNSASQYISTIGKICEYCVSAFIALSTVVYFAHLFTALPSWLYVTVLIFTGISQLTNQWLLVQQYYKDNKDKQTTQYTGWFRPLNNKPLNLLMTLIVSCSIFTAKTKSLTTLGTSLLKQTLYITWMRPIAIFAAIFFGLKTIMRTLYAQHKNDPTQPQTPAIFVKKKRSNWLTKAIEKIQQCFLPYKHRWDIISLTLAPASKNAVDVYTTYLLTTTLLPSYTALAMALTAFIGVTGFISDSYNNYHLYFDLYRPNQEKTHEEKEDRRWWAFALNAFDRVGNVCNRAISIIQVDATGLVSKICLVGSCILDGFIKVCVHLKHITDTHTSPSPTRSVSRMNLAALNTAPTGRSNSPQAISKPESTTTRRLVEL